MQIDPVKLQAALDQGIITEDDVKYLASKFHSAKAPEAMQQAQQGEYATQGNNFLAGVGKGLTDVAQGAGNMVGLVDDDTITQRRVLDKALMGTTGGKVGSFVGEMAGTAPLAYASAPAALLNKATKAVKLTTKSAPALRKAKKAMLALSEKGMGIGSKYAKTTAAAKAAGEGALASAILANPNERWEAAGTGAALGAGFNQAFRAGGRVLNRGLVKKDPNADEVVEFIAKQLGKNKEEVFMPVPMARKHGGLSGLAAFPSGVAGLTPAGRAMLNRQKSQFDDQLRRALGNQAFPGPKGSTPGGFSRVLDEQGGNLKKAVAKASRLSARGKQRNAPASTGQLAVARAARKTKAPDGKFTGTDYQQAYDDIFNQMGNEAFTDTATDLAGKAGVTAGKSSLPAKIGEVSRHQLSESDIAKRAAFYKFVGNIGRAGKNIGGGILDVSTLGTASLIGGTLSSKPVQRALMGDATVQRWFRDAMKTRSGEAVNRLGQAIRRTLSAQFAEKDIPPELAASMSIELANGMLEMADNGVDYFTAGGAPAVAGRIKGDVINNLPAVKLAEYLRG